MSCELERPKARDVVVTNAATERRIRWLVLACALALLLAVPIVATADADHHGPQPPIGHAAEGARAAGQGEAAAQPPSAGAPVPFLAEPPAPPSAPPSALRAAPPAGRGAARAAVEAAESAAAGSTELAVAVLDRDTGELALGDRAGEGFYTASLSKVVVAVDMLERRRSGELEVTPDDLGLLRRALGPSDDAAMNGLWSRFDGIGAAERVGARLGLSGTRAPGDPGQWGQMRVPAADTVRIWRHILEGMAATDRDFLIGAMDAAPAVARDGFDQQFGLLAPAVDGGGGPGAVAKQGWMCCFSGAYYLNSAGAVGPDQRFLVTLLSRIPRGDGWAAAREELTRIATAAVGPLEQR